MKVSPLLALVLGLFFGGLFLLQVWAGERWRDYQGPDYVSQDYQGNLYIIIRSKILRYNAQGAFLDQKDLTSIGVSQFMGNISFFPNGDLLLIPKEYNPSILERIKMVFRITPKVQKAAPASQLSRCKWDTLACDVLPNFSASLLRTFWTHIDKDENIFVSDTTHHRLLWLSSNGTLLDEYADKDLIQFPNQLYRKDNLLWFANCNDNSVSHIGLADHKFTKDLIRYKALDRIERWPTGLVWTGNQFISLVQGDNLEKGSLYSINEGEHTLTRIQKNRMGDFISIGFFQNKILAADYRSLAIRQYDLDGTLLPDFITPEFVKIASEFKYNQRLWKRFELLFKSAFWIALIIGFAAALWLEKKYKASQGGESCAENRTPVHRRHIQWISCSQKRKNSIKWSIWFLSGLLVLIFPAVFSAEEESVLGASLLFLVYGVVLLTLLQNYRLLQVEIGALVPWIYIRGFRKRADGTQKLDSFNESEVLSFSILGSCVLMIGTYQLLVKKINGNPLYEGKMANEYLDRLISISTPLSLLERINWLFNNRFAEVVASFFYFCVFVFALLVANLVK